jgi:catalase
LAIDGDAAKFNFREDDQDYYSQPGNLFRMLKPDAQQRLFENTARSIAKASKGVQDRHIGNCSKADPAYGQGVANAIAALQQQNHKPPTAANGSVASREGVGHEQVRR